jgi:LemA protein
MLTSPLAWLAAALLLFWAFGAYNRLVRLRADAKIAFEQVERQLQQEVLLVSSLQAQVALRPHEAEPAAWITLQGAATQLAVTLALARQAPLDTDRVDALCAAGDVLAMAWERIQRLDTHDLAGPRLPEELGTQHATLRADLRAAKEAFNRAVANYNEAIAQFPAALLAWVFAFRPGRPL